MDLLSQHEAFLRAIFDAPDDDTPRLVYADFLQENGDEDRAEFIRVQCELALPDVDDARKKELVSREKTLVGAVVPWHEPAFSYGCRVHRGFWHEEVSGGIELTSEHFTNVTGWRASVVKTFPSWYGEARLGAVRGVRLYPEHINQLFGLPFFQQVEEWNLSGQAVDYSTLPVVEPHPDIDVNPGRLTGFRITPVIAKAGVNVLAWHRAARHMTVLDLRNNNLDNDVVRALMKSPFLGNLKRLELSEGNRFSGRAWRQLIERFGENVVG